MVLEFCIGYEMVIKSVTSWSKFPVTKRIGYELTGVSTYWDEQRSNLCLNGEHQLVPNHQQYAVDNGLIDL